MADPFWFYNNLWYYIKQVCTIPYFTSIMLNTPFNHYRWTDLFFFIKMPLNDCSGFRCQKKLISMQKGGVRNDESGQILWAHVNEDSWICLSVLCHYFSKSLALTRNVRNRFWQSSKKVCYKCKRFFHFSRA